MTEKYLSQEEQEAREYCLHHVPERPSVSRTKLIGQLVLMESIVCTLSIILFLWTDTFLIYHLLGNLLCFFFAGKWLLISLVQLYQHYAPETVRRKCLCKPTCSEYAILALRKYNTYVALQKIYRRLFVTCRGIHYQIDYP